MELNPLPAPLTPRKSWFSPYERVPAAVPQLFKKRVMALAERTGYDLETMQAMFGLWLKAWFGEPSASVADDDTQFMADLECDSSRWAAMKPLLLAGWVKCRDGRLYEPELAAIARATWKQRRGRPPVLPSGPPPVPLYRIGGGAH